MFALVFGAPYSFFCASVTGSPLGHVKKVTSPNPLSYNRVHKSCSLRFVSNLEAGVCQRKIQGATCLLKEVTWLLVDPVAKFLSAARLFSCLLFASTSPQKLPPVWLLAIIKS